MNKVLVPIITFKPIVSDERRIKAAYARIFDIARKNILAKRLLTTNMSQKYTKVQDEEKIFNSNGSGQNAKSQQEDGLSVGREEKNTSLQVRQILEDKLN